MIARRMRCSFCRRSDSEVAKLVAGPMRIFGRVYICDRCAVQTIHIMDTHTADDASRDKKPSFLRRSLDRLGRPRGDRRGSSTEFRTV